MKVGDGSTSAIQIVVGFILMLAGIGTIGSGSFFGIVVMGIGLFLLWHGIEWGSLRRVQQAYKELLGSGSRINLNKLAERLDMGLDEVRDSLQELSHCGMIAKTNFVAADTTKASATKPQQPESGSGATAPQTPGTNAAGQPQTKSNPDSVYVAQNPQPTLVAVRCRSCGAITQLRPGEVVECEHCGNPLSI